MKKGFTLVEMIAVILIMALLTLVVLPTIINQVQSQKDNISASSLELIEGATELYLEENENEYPMISGATYCITLETLTNDGKLKKPIKDLSTGKEIPLNKVVKVVANSYGDGEYTLVNANECETVMPDIEEETPSKQYTEQLLNGADPVLKGELIPVTISSNGTVRMADTTKKWYSYQNKEWANAVILKHSTTYAPGNVIAEENIESYFVWIPKYSYQLWDMGTYSSLTNIDSSKVHSISIKFGLENTNDSKQNECTTPGITGSSGNCKIGDYMTHPAFLTFNTNGLWVGKFQTGYDGATTTAAAQVNQTEASKVIIKPNAYSWRGITVGNAFKTSYDYKRNLESHLMKNTEWGAVAYLSYSQYGINKGVRNNNNSACITGYAATTEPTIGYAVASMEGTVFGKTARGEDTEYTINYLNPSSVVASTTGNYSGIYDMSGATWEYVMGYSTTASTPGANSGITDLYSDFFTNNDWKKYYDAVTTGYQNRILGDATGETGPFEKVTNDADGVGRFKGSWHGDFATFVNGDNPWFVRGGRFNHGTYNGVFAFTRYSGAAGNIYGFRVVLTV